MKKARDERTGDKTECRSLRPAFSLSVAYACNTVRYRDNDYRKAGEVVLDEKIKTHPMVPPV